MASAKKKSPANRFGDRQGICRGVGFSGGFQIDGIGQNEVKSFRGSVLGGPFFLCVIKGLREHSSWKRAGEREDPLEGDGWLR
jgi:hypothetical protein